MTPQESASSRHLRQNSCRRQPYIGNGTGQRRAYRQAGDAHAGGQQRQHQLGQSQAERRNGAAHYPHG